jgi:hypothetical protein
MSRFFAAAGGWEKTTGRQGQESNFVGKNDAGRRLGNVSVQ